MTHPSKRKGNLAESAVVDYLRSLGHDVHRAVAGAANDCGDIAGIPGVVIQVKNQKRMELGQWMDELRAQMVNANASFGILIVKRRGKSNPKDWYWIIEGDGHASALFGLSVARLLIEENVGNDEHRIAVLRPRAAHRCR